MDSQIEDIECAYINKGTRHQEVERVAIESHLSLYVKDEPIAEFDYSPGLTEQLVFGYLRSSGMISQLSDITDIAFDSETCKVSLVDTKQSSSMPSSKRLELTWDNLMKIRDLLLKNQKNHHATRGFHAGIIYEIQTGRWFSCEDIRRHNVVDKVVGYALQEQFSFLDSILFITGRLTSELVSKSCQTGVPLIASLTVATSSGIELARQMNCTLLGSVSRDSCWLYHEGALKIMTDTSHK